MSFSPDHKQLDISFGRFLASHSTSESKLLFKAGRLVSQVRRGGNTCVRLEEVDPSMTCAAVEKALLTTELVGEAGDYCPLIIHNDLLYLHRYFKFETIVADFINRSTEDSSRCKQVESLLDELFPAGTVDGVDDQKTAAISSLCNSFSVISGGPGTGKTTTVAKVLALHIGLNPDLRIMLAAPTGKAATRLEESLAKTLGTLDIMAENGALSVQTIHRLLGFSTSGFRYNAKNLLPADLVLVDEASMVDLPLMADLMSALPPHCRLILLGDAYQLSSVQPGAVLAEIYAGAEEGGGGSVRGIVTLRKSFRFTEDSGIRLLADCIKRGDGRAGLRLLEDENYADVSLIPHDVSTIITSSCQAYAGATPEAVLTGFDQLGVLCCHRSGDFGVEDINSQVMQHLGYTLHQYFHGLPLMILANDHNLRLYNGDTCVVAEEEGRFYACLQTREGLRRIPVRKLPIHAPAYGITVHKSQGSEYNEVAFLFPPGASQVLGRELVYTAITRARKSVVIHGTAEQFVDAVAHRVVRVSGLSKRLSGVTC